MNRLAILAFSCCALILSGSLAASETEIMPVKDIKPGMKGYGLTVFQGSTPEKFEVEVVGVLENNEPHQDLIVVRSSHPTLSHTGICGGMSGSPIYIEGKLIGAASRFFKLFPKDLLTGVTPIERMIEDGNRPTQGTAGANGMTLPPRGGKKETSFEPIPLPFTISGAGPRAEAYLQEAMAPFGVHIMKGGASGTASDTEEVPTDLQPGDAFGVVLVRGDMDFSSGGTITHRDGKKILGFGHPFFMAGDLEMPMTTARVFTVMSSLQRSDKMQIPLKEVGALTIDRQSCVAGEIGKKASMIPVKILTKNLNTGVNETFHFEVMRHPLLTPIFFNFAFLGAVDSAESTILPTTVDTQMKIWIEGREKPVELEETYAIASGSTTFSMPSPVSILANNPFKVIQIEKIEAELGITHERNTAVIEAAWLDVKEVEPGGEVKAYVRLKPFNGEEETLSVTVKVPKNLPDDSYDLEVGGGTYFNPDVAPATDVEGIIRFLEANYKKSDLITILELGTLGTRQEGKALRQLPFSVFGTLFSSNEAGVSVEPDTLRVVTPTPYVLSGKKGMKIKVTSKGGGE